MAMDLEVAEAATGHTRRERALAVLVGLTAVVAALLATLEVDANKRQEQAQARSARLTVEALTTLTGSSYRVAAAAQTLQASAIRGLASTSRQLAYFDHPVNPDFEGVLAATDQHVESALGALAQMLAGPIGPESGVDAATRQVVNASTDDAAEIVARQNRQVAVASRYGAMGSRAVLALSLLAVAAVLFGLTAVLRTAPGGGTTLVTGGCALLASALCGASALFVH